MTILSWPLFPLALGFLFLTAAGCWEFRTYRVPNWLVLLGLLAALLFAAAQSLKGTEAGGVSGALSCSLLAAGLLLPLYSTGGLGAGCVKAHGAFGAWLGCAYTINDGVLLVLFSTR